jgi:hypothetical protein
LVSAIDLYVAHIPRTEKSAHFLCLALTVQGNSITIDTGTTAVIDTGTTNIGGPSSAIQAIYAQIPNSQPATGDLEGYYSYRKHISRTSRGKSLKTSLACSTTVNVELSFGGSTWSISPEDFAFTTLSSGSTECVGAFFETTTGSGAPTWIIGDAFLVRNSDKSRPGSVVLIRTPVFLQKNVYSVFRYNPPSVGFAALSSVAIAENGAGGTVPSATIGTASTSVTNTSAAPRGHTLTTSLSALLLALSAVLLL